MNMVQKAWKHFCMINKHRWLVFKLSIKAGIPLRGLLHDLSKYSYTEFWESAKYYDGTKSPIKLCRLDKGYSLSWLHHKAKNKHHFEYWEDMTRDSRFGVFLPYKYMVEALCDKIAAGMAYTGKEWTNKQPFEYWNRVERDNVIQKHPATYKFMDTALKKIADDGLDSVLNRKYLKSLYNECKKN